MTPSKPQQQKARAEALEQLEAWENPDFGDVDAVRAFKDDLDAMASSLAKIFEIPEGTAHGLAAVLRAIATKIALNSAAVEDAAEAVEILGISASEYFSNRHDVDLEEANSRVAQIHSRIVELLNTNQVFDDPAAH